jgi:hypothetical protein
MFARLNHTNFDTPPTKPIPRDNHLTQTKFGTVDGKETDRHGAENVEKEGDQDTIDEAEVEERLSEDTNGERSNDHVGGEPLFVTKSQYVIA